MRNLQDEMSRFVRPQRGNVVMGEAAKTSSVSYGSPAWFKEQGLPAYNLQGMDFQVNDDGSVTALNEYGEPVYTFESDGSISVESPDEGLSRDGDGDNPDGCMWYEDDNGQKIEINSADEAPDGYDAFSASPGAPCPLDDDDGSDPEEEPYYGECYPDEVQYDEYSGQCYCPISNEYVDCPDDGTK